MDSTYFFKHVSLSLHHLSLLVSFRSSLAGKIDAAFHGKSEFFTWHFLDIYSQIFQSGLWNCHLLASPLKTSQICILFRYSSVTYLCSLQQLLTFQCKSDGIYWNECPRMQHRVTVSDSQQTQADLVELMTPLWCFENIFFSQPGELQDWHTADLKRIWEDMWGFCGGIIRTTWVAMGSVKWGIKDRLS